MRDKRNAYEILVGVPEGYRYTGIANRRWSNNVKMDSKRTGCDGLDWIHPDEDGGPVAGACEHRNEPWFSAKCLEYLE